MPVGEYKVCTYQCGVCTKPTYKTTIEYMVEKNLCTILETVLEVVVDLSRLGECTVAMSRSPPDMVIASISCGLFRKSFIQIVI